MVNGETFCVQASAWIFLDVVPSNDENHPEWWALMLLLLAEIEAQRGGVIGLDHTLVPGGASGSQWEPGAVRRGPFFKGMGPPPGLEGQAGHPRLPRAAAVTRPEALLQALLRSSAGGWS